VWCLALAIGVAGPAGAQDLSERDQVTARLICDCGCSNLTIKECTCGKADQVRAEVSARLAAGQTPEQIVAAYVNEYGEQILAAPAPQGFNLVGWLLPFFAVAGTGALLLWVLRRWSRVPWSEAPLVAPLGSGPAPPPDPAFLKLVEQEMEEEDR
jgi:cytochrome c-type biogenesis protein CcmH